jgi:hypothetical protein
VAAGAVGLALCERAKLHVLCLQGAPFCRAVVLQLHGASLCVTAHAIVNWVCVLEILEGDGVHAFGVARDSSLSLRACCLAVDEGGVGELSGANLFHPCFLATCNACCCLYGLLC